jgi:putative glutamine amidotransferase
MPLVVVSHYPSNWENYRAWLHETDANLRFEELHPLTPDKRTALLTACDGVLLAGGGDVHPSHYGAPWDAALHHDVDEERDNLEIALVRMCGENGLPLLGVCRGIQVANVALGGTLIADLALAGRGDHQVPQHLQPASGHVDAEHDLAITADSRVGALAGTLARVNSNHHQAVGLVAPALRATALAPDGTPEALEWRDTTAAGFLLLVQWHPERLARAHPLASGVARLFVDAVKKGNRRIGE